MQFDDVCLDAALYLLEKGKLAETARSNPVYICRCISAMVGFEFTHRAFCKETHLWLNLKHKFANVTKAVCCWLQSFIP